MFQPPRCPYRNCSQHLTPSPRFYIKRGSYQPLCRSQPVPRFRCRTCRRTFSRQTFRADYRDHEPALNARLLVRLAAGVGLRQSARELGLSLRCLEMKARKISGHVRRLALNLGRDESSLAALLGPIPRARTAGEWLSWRQDWGARSVHPRSSGRRSIGEWAPKRAS